MPEDWAVDGTLYAKNKRRLTSRAWISAPWQTDRFGTKLANACSRGRFSLGAFDEASRLSEIRLRLRRRCRIAGSARYHLSGQGGRALRDAADRVRGQTEQPR